MPAPSPGTVPSQGGQQFPMMGAPPDNRDVLAQLLALDQGGMPGGMGGPMPGGPPPLPGGAPPVPTGPGLGGPPDLSSRTRMPPMTPESGGTQVQIPPQFQPQWQPPPGPTWQPTPTSPFGGIDINAWKDPSRPPQPIGVGGNGPSAQELEMLKMLTAGKNPAAGNNQF